MEYTDLEIECFDYLEELRQSGVTNMYGARPYLMDAFDLDKREAGRILSLWMKDYPYLMELRGWRR